MFAWSAELRRALLAPVLLLALSCEQKAEPRLRLQAQAAVEYQKEPIQALVAEAALDRELVELGGRLFHDPVLSSDGTISCASCHDIAGGGDDGRPQSVGVKGAVGGINAPSVLNAGLNFVQFWDGRAATLEEQAGGPITNPAEMGSQWPAVLDALRKDQRYQPEFARLFADGVSEVNVRKALATFQRSLVTVDARFDRWLGGDKAALNPEEAAGYELFKSAGCVACHQGKNVGGNMFQRFGVMGDYFAERGNVKEADLGRFNVTRSPADRHVFRVPSLRNVEMTAPYFHDGSAATLQDAVRVMAKYQLGRPLDDPSITRIVAFLKALTGKIPDVTRFGARSATRG